MPKKKAVAAVAHYTVEPDPPSIYVAPRYSVVELLFALVDVVELLARQSGVAEIREKVEELQARLKV